MKRTSICIDDALSEAINVLKKPLSTSTVAYILRFATIQLAQKFLGKNVDVSTFVNQDKLQTLSAETGLEPEVVESHFVRFRKCNITPELYRQIVAASREDFQRMGGAWTDLEAAVFERLQRWTRGLWSPEKPAS